MASEHRRTLGEYSAPMLDQMLTISASACLMAYFLYTFIAEPDHRRGAPEYDDHGAVRDLRAVSVSVPGAHQPNAGGSPEQLLLEDRPLLLNVVLYVIAAAVALKM